MEMRAHMNSLRGKLFSLVELAALPKPQEQAFKTCIRTTTYEAQAALEAALRED